MPPHAEALRHGSLRKSSGNCEIDWSRVGWLQMVGSRRRGVSPLTGDLEFESISLQR